MKRVSIKTRSPIRNLRSVNRVIVGEVTIRLSDDDIERCKRAGARVTILDTVSNVVPVETEDHEKTTSDDETVVTNTEGHDETSSDETTSDDETVVTSEDHDDETSEETVSVETEDHDETTSDESVVTYDYSRRNKKRR